MIASPEPKWGQMARTVVGLMLAKRPLPPNVRLPELLAFADKNSLLYGVGLALMAKRPFPAPFEAKMQQAEARAAGTMGLLDLLLPRFAAANLPLLTIKSFLPFAYVDSNIDCVCIPPQPASAYTAVLEQAGFYRLRNLADVREPLKQMFAPPATSPSLPRYHLHTAVSWNGVDYLDLTEVWQRRLPLTVGTHPILHPAPRMSFSFWRLTPCLKINT